MVTWPRCLVYVGDPRSNEMGAESDGELRGACRHSTFLTAVNRLGTCAGVA